MVHTDTTQTTKIRGALFDFCGTIFNNEQFHTAAIHSAFIEYIDPDIEIDDDELKSNVGLTYEDRLQNMLAMRGIDDDELLAKMAIHTTEYYRNANKSDALVPGVDTLIKQFHANNIQLGIVTNAPTPTVKKQLEEVQLLQYFKTVIGSDTVSRLKPHPEPYDKGLTTLGLTPQETIVFEDSPVGVEAAWLLDIPVVGILTNFTPDELHKTVKTIHDYTNVSLSELEELVS